MVAMRSRALLPELVMSVNSTRLPELSFNVSPSKRNPAFASVDVASRILQSGVEPKMVRGRNRPVSRFCVTGIDDAAKIVAIDGKRNGFAEFRGAKPTFFMFRQW